MCELGKFCYTLDMYSFISALFAVVVILANLLTVKLVKLPWVAFAIPCGLLLYPVASLLTNLTVEFYGKEEAKKLIYRGLVVALLSTLVLEGALLLPSQDLKTQEMLTTLFHVNSASIFSSLAAFLVSQILEAALYCKIGQLSSWIVVRNLGSTFASQCIDTLIVNMLLFYFLLDKPLGFVLPIMAFSLLYKMAASMALAPLYSLLVPRLRRSFA